MQPVKTFGQLFRRESGQVLVMFALGLPILIAALGFSVDIGVAVVTRTSEQKTVDAAAIAGGDILLGALVGAPISTGSCATSSTPVQCEAKLYTTKNGYADGDVTVYCKSGQCASVVTTAKCPTAEPNKSDCISHPDN